MKEKQRARVQSLGHDWKVMERWRDKHIPLTNASFHLVSWPMVGLGKYWIPDSLFRNLQTKHRKNCKRCPCHSLFKGHNVNVNIVVLNCQKCNQCFNCQVSGHKSLGLLFEVMSCLLITPSLWSDILLIVIMTLHDDNSWWQFSDFWKIFMTFRKHPQNLTLDTCDTDYISDNWEQQY